MRQKTKKYNYKVIDEKFLVNNSVHKIDEHEFFLSNKMQLETWYQRGRTRIQI